VSGSPIYSFKGYLLFGSLNPLLSAPERTDSSDGLGVASPSAGGVAIGAPASFSSPPVPALP
jgi:hypothetical protein